MSQRKLIFLHVPKTAGTSLVKLFNKQYRAQHIAYIHGNDQQAFDRALAEGKKFIHGHFTSKIVKQAPADYLKVTLLRDPVARVISRYVHMAHADEPSLKEEFAQYAGFEEYLQSAYAQNFQCQMLADALFTEISAEDLLAKAMENLKQLDWVAPSENLNEAAQDLQKRLGFKVRQIGKDNTSSSQQMWQELYDQYSQQIAALNRLDQQLYEAGVQKFEALPRLKKGFWG